MALSDGAKKWLDGLVGAVISSAANSIVVLVVDPAKFSPSATGGWANLGMVIAVSGIFGAGLYLKQKPTPDAPAPVDPQA